MDSLLPGLVILQVLSLCFGAPGGAPPSACEDMMPRHGAGVQQQATPTPYDITTNTKTFQDGQYVKVTITGPIYRGVLLEARTGDSPKALGSWKNPPANTRPLQCPGDQGVAMTHANTETKGNATVYSWMPPKDIGSVYFRATVAQTQAVYWQNIRSDPLSRGESPPLPAGSPGIADKIRFLLLLTPCLLVSKVLLW